VLCGGNEPGREQNCPFVTGVSTAILEASPKANIDLIKRLIDKASRSAADATTNVADLIGDGNVKQPSLGYAGRVV